MGVKKMESLLDKQEESRIITLVGMLDIKIERLNKLKLRLAELLSGKYSIDTVLEEMDWIIQDICDEFNNCSTCPARKVCDISISFLCKGMYFCEECPKLHKCLERGILELEKVRDNE
jgi:hypothetical protein